MLFTGLAGVGKSTIATEVHKLLNTEAGSDIVPYARNSSLFLHHLIIDFVKAVVPREKCAFTHMHKRRDMLHMAIDAMAADSDHDRVLIITALATMGVEGELMRQSEMQAYIDLARVRHVPLIHIHLTCDPSEHRERVSNPGRLGTKIRDYDLLQRNIALEDDSIDRIFANGINRRGVARCEETIDTTGRSIEYTALRILQMVQMVTGFPQNSETQDGT